MKHYNIIYILIFCSGNIFGQLPTLQFDSITPKWYFFIKDSLFVSGSNPDINMYSSVGVGGNLPAFVDDTVYCLFNSFSQDNNFQNGGIIEKINIKTGENIWTKILNTNHGFNYLAFGEFSPKKGGDLFLVGRERTNIKPEDTQWRFGGFSRDFLLEINSQDGMVRNKLCNKNDSIGKLQFLSGPHEHFFVNDFQKLKRSSFESSQLKFRIDDFNRNSGEYEFSQYLPTNLDMPKSNVNKVPYNFTELLSSDRLLSFHYITSKNTNQYPDESYIQWFQMDGDTFTLDKALNVKNYFKKLFPPVLGYDFFFSKISDQGELCISKTWHDPTATQFVKYWILWLDKEGNEKVYIGEPIINGSEHQYGILVPFYVNDTNVYFWASPSITGKEGMDILKLGQDKQLQVLGSLTTGETKRMSGFRVNMNDKGDIVMILIWDNTYSTVVGFHASDFGFSLSSAKDENFAPAPLMTVSPNPASDDITMHITDEKCRQGTVRMYNVAGQNVVQQKISHGESLNIRDLPAGTYIVQFSPDSRPGYFLTTKLVKE